MHLIGKVSLARSTKTCAEMEMNESSIVEQCWEEGYSIARQLFDNLEPYYDDAEW